MDFVLIKGGSNFRFPVTPAEFSIQSGNMNQTVTVVRRGEINLWGPENLEGLTIESFFPNQQYNFCTYAGFPKPWECVKTIDDWRNSGEPLRIVIVDSKLNVDINYEVLIESFEKGLRDSTGDVYFTLSLRRYKRLNVPIATSNYQAPTIRTTPPTKITEAEKDSTNKINADGSITSTTQPEKTYTVVDGDTLWDIAKDHLGNGSDWQRIFEFNKTTIKDPNSIDIGQIIKLPS